MMNESTGTTQAPEAQYAPPIPQEGVDEGRIIFKDGSTAILRPAEEQDIPKVKELLDSLSERSRFMRFFGTSSDTDELARRLLHLGDPETCYTLVVLRGEPGNQEIIGVGSYILENEDERAAETAYLVRDDYQGRGIGTLLLERLALIAARHGLRRFKAYTHPDNRKMLDVFRSSGFAVEESMEHGSVEASFPVEPGREMVEKSETRDRIATVASLQPFFEPRGVAVIGASRDPGSIGYRVLHQLILNRYQGPVYPINPNADHVASVSAYDSVLDVPGPVDMAVIAVPPDVIPEVVDQCHKKDVHGLVILTAGFSETGEKGKQRQKQLRDQVFGYGMRMIGPNCLGILNTDPEVRLNASFSPVFPPPGNVAMASQSGALGLAIIDYATSQGIGFSHFVSLGNKADVSGNDLLLYWEDDEHTDVLLLYLESFGNPRRFARITKRIGTKKPIMVVKGGRSEAGRQAASSHTAALTSSNVAVEALFEQAGIVHTDTLEEMFNVADFMSSQPLPAGPNVAIVTNAGGPGILCADACENGGLALSELSSETREQLRSVLPETASLANPIDMIASAAEEEYQQTVQSVMQDESVDAVIVIYIPLELTPSAEIARAIEDGVRNARASGAEETPVLSVFIEPEEENSLEVDDERIPLYRFPESAAVALSKAYRYKQWRDETTAQPPIVPQLDDLDTDRAEAICNRIAREGGGWLSAVETRDVCSAVGIPMADLEMATTPDEAVEIADQFGYPVVLKMASRTLIHKTEWDGIALDLEGPQDVRDAYEDIVTRLEEAGRADELDGMVVQEMIHQGMELMVGMNEDELFGPLVTFGLGGVYVEILEDVTVRITPLTDQDAQKMLEGIRGRKLLEGYRGHPPADKDALKELLLRISRLVEEVPVIKEMDMNPLKAFPPGEGYRVLDARIRVKGRT